MIDTKKAFIAVLSLLLFLGILGVAAGFLLGAEPFHLGGVLIREAAERFPVMLERLRLAFGSLLNGAA